MRDYAFGGSRVARPRSPASTAILKSKVGSRKSKVQKSAHLSPSGDEKGRTSDFRLPTFDLLSGGEPLSPPRRVLFDRPRNRFRRRGLGEVIVEARGGGFLLVGGLAIPGQRNERHRVAAMRAQEPRDLVSLDVGQPDVD